MAEDLSFANDQLHLVRAPSTWRKLVGPWRRARAYIMNKVEADGRVFDRATLSKYTYYVAGAAVDAFKKNPAVSAVSSCLQACAMALRVSGITMEKHFLAQVMERVCKGKRHASARKVAAITWEEAKLALYNDEWGARGADIVNQMLSIALVLLFKQLL